MAVNSDIRDFYFYSKYLWSPGDFEDLQQWLSDKAEGVASGAFGAACLSGLKVSVASGLQVSITSGIAVDPDGRIVVVPSTENATFASPSGNPAKSLVVLRPTTTDAEDIDEPTNPTNQVPLHKKLTYSVVVIDGSPAASPVYPSTQANDIVLMGVNLTASQSSLAATNFDYSVRSVPRKKVTPVKAITAAYNMATTDAHIEANATSAAMTVLLPSSLDCPGEDFIICKNDSSSNAVSVSGQGTQVIDGQTVWELSSQYEKIRVRSLGTEWRVL